jgi:hypothetical protein
MGRKKQLRIASAASVARDRRIKTKPAESASAEKQQTTREKRKADLGQLGQHRVQSEIKQKQRAICSSVVYLEKQGH